MEYTPHNWTTGETVTSNKLNHIEEGISDAAGEINELNETIDSLDYNDLDNKPSINGVELEGEMTIGDIENRTADLQTGKMGYKILDASKTFAEQVIEANTIYEIRSPFSLGENAVTIPVNSELRFNGGGITDGELVLQNTLLSGDVKIGLSVVVTGNVANEFVTPKMFGATGDGTTDDTNAFMSSIEVSNHVKVTDGTYLVSSPLATLNISFINGQGIVIRKSNFTMEFSEGSKLTTFLPLDEPLQQMRAVITILGERNITQLTEQRIENIKIIGATIEGARSQFTIPQSSPNDSKENYIGIIVSSADNVEITNCTITDNTGDAVFTMGADNVIVKGLVSKRNRRAMVSFGTGDGCAVIDSSSEMDCVYVEYPNGNSSYGTAPRGIICTEDDSYGAAYEKTIKNVTIRGNHFIAPEHGTFVVLGPFDGLLLENNLIDNATINNNLVTTINGERTKSRGVIIRNNTIKCANGYEHIASQFAFNCHGVDIISGNYVDGYSFANLYTDGDPIVENNWHNGIDFIRIASEGDTRSCKITIMGNITTANTLLLTFDSANLTHKHIINITGNTVTGEYPRYNNSYIILAGRICEKMTISDNILESRVHSTIPIIRDVAFVNVGELLVSGNTIRMLQGTTSYPFNGGPYLCDGIFIGNYFEFAGNCGKASVGTFTGKMVFVNNVMNKQMTQDTESNANLIYVNNTII